MRLDYVRHLGGPNIFTTGPVSIARVELDELTCRETTSYPGFTERLVMAMPGLREHHCATGLPGGFIEAMTRGTYFGHVIEHVMLELSALAGREVHLGRTLWAGADGRYDVMTECPVDEPAESVIPGELFRLAITVVRRLLEKERPDFADHLARIASAAERERLGPSTAAIAAAARRRGIPVRRLGGMSMLQFGYGCHRRRLNAALTEHTSALGVDIACDKVLAKEFLRRAGIAVPDGRLVRTPAAAGDALRELGAPVVIKPRNGNHGRCVTVGARTSAEVEQAYRRAAAGSGSADVIVEAYVPGTDYRLLVIDGRVAAAAELVPPEVTGDGARTIGELIDELNADPRRGQGHSRVLTVLTIDETMLAHLATGGLDLATVPSSGQVVRLRRNGNLSTGGTSRDVTDQVHPDLADLATRAANEVGLDMCGVDLRCEDIGAPLFPPQPGSRRPPVAAVIEVNACPGLRMHLAPFEGTARDVADAVIDRLYPPGAPSRIPIISVTGTNGKTTVTRMIAHVLRQAGLRAGMCCTDGVYIGGRCVLEADAAGPHSAQIVLGDGSVEAAVLEVARGGILRRGLGYDLADVAVITNVSADHLGDDQVDDIHELIDVKALVAEQLREGGSVVLNADDEAVAAIAARSRLRRRTPVIRFFSVTQGSSVISTHRQAGGICYEVADGQLTESAGGRQRNVLGVAELPGAFGGRATHVVANALAAIAACRAVGVTIKDIRAALRSFTPAEANPGRGCVYAVPVRGATASSGAPLSGDTPDPDGPDPDGPDTDGPDPDGPEPAGLSDVAPTRPVLLDYGHNAAALHAIGQLVAEVWGGLATATITLPGDRRDDLVVESARAVAAWFGRVVIYEDTDRRGRQAGELRGLIANALRDARPDIEIAQADGAHEALRIAVQQPGRGPVLFVYEKLADARSALEAIGARSWRDDHLMGDGAAGHQGALGLAGKAVRPGAARHPRGSTSVLDEIAAELALAAADVDATPMLPVRPARVLRSAGSSQRASTIGT